MATRGLLVAALFAGCYAPPEDSCGITCETECPGDLTCSADHLCVPTDGSECVVPPLGLVQLALGGHHACGLDADGGLYCWGDNRDGQLGLNVPTPIVARPTKLPGTWEMVAAGGAHTCGLSGGAPSCWGLNDNGQVHAMNGGTYRMPVAVPFGPTAHPPFETIAAGGTHTCVVGGGQLWCWGKLEHLGTNGVDGPIATRVGTAEDWSMLTLGTDFGCALSAANGVMCWGSNDDAQVSFPTTAGFVMTPTKVPLPPGTIVALDAGANDVCAVISPSGGATGNLWCWGDNHVIDGKPIGAPTAPTQLGTDDGWTKIAVGDHHMCGILRGRAYCWGTGILGGGLWNDQRVFTQAVDLGPADEIATNERAIDVYPEHSVCLRTGAEVRCFGDNTFGELGLGQASWYPTPAEVMPPQGTTWTQVKSGEEHSCAQTADKRLLCWGNNEVGAVNPVVARGQDQPCIDGEPCDYARPEPAPFQMVDELVTGWDYTCTRTGGTVNCWGDNRDGRLGAPNVGHGPSSLTGPGTTVFQQISGGNDATCGHLDNTQIACWGDVAGNIRTTPTTEASPVLVEMAELSFGYRFGCGVRDDDQRVCWGTQNETGQLGNNTTTANPTPVLTNDRLLEIAARGNHACALTEGLQIVCWGSNFYGESGTATNQPVVVPTLVLDANGELDNCASIAVADRHSCAICAGKPLCWGENKYSELGRGIEEVADSRRTAAPVLVPDLVFTEVTALDGGGCALSNDGRLFCWGDSWRGAIGTGGSARNLPTPIAGAF